MAAVATESPPEEGPGSLPPLAIGSLSAAKGDEGGAAAGVAVASPGSTKGDEGASGLPTASPRSAKGGEGGGAAAGLATVSPRKADEGGAAGGASIRVAVRIRPFNEKEAVRSADEKPLEAIGSDQILVRPHGDGYLKQDRFFSYDHVLCSVDADSPAYASQAHVFDVVGHPIIENAFSAFNGCLLAYGQTGSGKSYSVLGSGSGEERGVLPRACEEVFEQIARRRSEAEESGRALQVTVLVSYLEIYQEKIHDLLSASNTDLQVRIHPVLGPHVPSLTESPVSSMNQVQELLDFGSKNRIVASTLMNAQSSRSHAVFTLELRLSLSGNEQQSKIHFVDLAGSEKQKKTDAEGRRFSEGIAINQSLTILSRCIMALSTQSSQSSSGSSPMRRRSSVMIQAPFRESKLTLLLKDALSGNSKTALIACISPSAMNLEESLSTLDFASRCKLIKTSAKKNEQSKADLVESLAAEKRAVEAQLQQQMEEQQALQEKLEIELQQSKERKERARAMEREKQEIEGQLRLLELTSKPDAEEEEEGGERGPRASRVDLRRRSADAIVQSNRAAQEEELRRAQEQKQAVMEELREGRERWEEERRRELEQHQALAEEVERQRLERERQVEAAEGARREVLQRLEEAQKQQEEAAEEWKAAQAQSEQRRGRLEELLRTQEVDREERERLGNELQDVQSELQRARDAMLESQREAEASRQEREEQLKRLEEERREAEGQAQELKDAQRSEQEKWEALLADKQRQAEKLQQANEATAERAAREYNEVVKRLEREKAEALMRKETEHGKTVAQLQARLAEMERTDLLRRKTTVEARSREQELQGQVEQDMKRHEGRIEELQKEMRGLQALSDSWAAQKQDLEQRAEEQRMARERMFRELGIAGVDGDDKETRHVPRLVNLHQDPMLEGCLVYYLRQGVTHVGTDSVCSVKLAGLGVLGQVCTITNQGDRSLTVRALQDELVRVNGNLVPVQGQELCDGDRLAVGRLHSFRAVVPNSRRRRPSEVAAVEQEFDRAMSEFETCALDARWRRRVEAAVVMAKAEFGTNEACQLLKRAVAASAAIAEADALNSIALAASPVAVPGVLYSPAHELVVLFEADTLPRVCIVCRQAGLDSALVAAGQTPPGARASCSRNSLGTSSSSKPWTPPATNPDGVERDTEPFRTCSSSLWEASRFAADRLPWLRKVAAEAKANGAAARASVAAARAQAAAIASAAPSDAQSSDCASDACPDANPRRSVRGYPRRSLPPGRRRSSNAERDEDVRWFCFTDRNERRSSSSSQSSWFWCCASGRPGRG